MAFKLSEKQLNYHDPRMGMSIVGRFLTKTAIFVFYSCFSVAAVLFSISGDSRKYLGWLFLIILIDRVWRGKDAWKKFNGNFYKKAESGNFINLFEYSDSEAKNRILRAWEGGILTGKNFFVLILKDFLETKKFQKIFLKLDVDPLELSGAVMEILNQEAPEKISKKDYIDLAQSLAISAMNVCLGNQIKAKDLLSAVFASSDPEIARLSAHFKIDGRDVKTASLFLDLRRKLGRIKSMPATLGAAVKFVGKPVNHRTINRAWTARPTPILDSFSEDLTDWARQEKIGLLMGHEQEYQRLENILSRQSKNNALLVGEPGSGRETIVLHLAYRIANDSVPKELFDKRLVMLSISRLVSGGQPQEIVERANKIIEEIIKSGNVILYIPDINNLINTSGAHYLSAADAFIPVLSRSDFQIIGTCSFKDYKTDIETRSDFASAFENISVEEISEEDAVRILTYASLILENQTKIDISFAAIKKSVTLSRRYFREKLLPSSAEELLKESLAFAKNRGDKRLNEEDVVSVAQAKLNIPLSEAGQAEAESLLNLEDKIHEKLIDQEEAVRAVSQALREYRAGLSRKNGPIASFLFVGPTGVGKTELAKILTKLQFGSEEKMIRFDMSEFQEKQNVSRFIGSSSEESGILTEAVRKNPFSLILLDEFEKAHQDILNIFLSVLDDGRLADASGRVVDFSNTIIIATSNAHSELIKNSLESGKNILEVGEEVKRRLTEYFKPELINRFSKVVAFKTLSKEDVLKITKILLKDVSKTAEENRGLIVDFSDSAIDHLLEIGYNPIYGARPMRNAISDNIKSVLSEKILSGEFNRGDKITIDFKDGIFRALMEKENEN